MPVKLGSLPSGDTHEFGNIGPFFRRDAQRQPERVVCCFRRLGSSS
jgi:hypothetical protein